VRRLALIPLVLAACSFSRDVTRDEEKVITFGGEVRGEEFFAAENTETRPAEVVEEHVEAPFVLDGSIVREADGGVVRVSIRRVRTPVAQDAGVELVRITSSVDAGTRLVVDAGGRVEISSHNQADTDAGILSAFWLWILLGIVAGGTLAVLWFTRRLPP